MSSAMIEGHPSPAKLELIRRFLSLSGLQAEIDAGDVVDRSGFARRKMFEDFAAAASPEMLYGDFLVAPGKALQRAYAPYRDTWQAEYEGHLNWEFTEGELAEITAFLERPAGRHFLEARWRMEAYIRTNTEGLADEIINQARRDLGLD